MKLNKLALPVVCLTLLYGCDRPKCTNTNPVFDRFSPETKAYKAELVKQLNNSNETKTSYWIEQYVEAEGRIFMSIYVQGEGLCAKTRLDITDTANGGSQIRGYKKIKGGGFSGAELSGLTYSIDSSTGDYNFILTDVAHIID